MVAGTALSGKEKAAIVVAMIGEEAAGKVLEHLEPEEIRLLALEVARLPTIDPSRQAPVLGEFVEMVTSARGLERAGPRLARRLLGRVLPGEVDRLIRDPDPPSLQDDEERAALPQLPARLLAASTRQLALLLGEEAPQTTALLLAHLPPRKAARVLLAMEPERRLEVTRRMASIREVRPAVVARVAEALEARLSADDEQPSVPVDGVQAAAGALTKMGRAAGKEIVEAMADDFPELSRQLRELLFTFDMLHSLSDRDCQEVLRQVDRNTLAVALKGGDPALLDLFTRNMSERAGQMLVEEIDLVGAPRLAEIERAQRTIVDLVLALEAEGTIALEEPAGAA